MSVLIKCRECGEISELPVEDWKLGKKNGTIESSKGRYDFWTCTKHKKSNGRKRNNDRSPTSTPDDRHKDSAAPAPKSRRKSKSTKSKQSQPDFSKVWGKPCPVCGDKMRAVQYLPDGNDLVDQDALDTFWICDKDNVKQKATKKELAHMHSDIEKLVRGEL